MSTEIRDVIIVGSGPAGYTAAIYAARANLSPLVVAGLMEPGGELMKTSEVENYPGFRNGITGPELMAELEAQAERFGAELLFEDAESVDLEGQVKKVVVDGETHLARTVVIATGSAHRKLGLKREDELSGRGVSYCATCDAAFFQDQEVAVVGGGDSAMEEALFLTKYAASVHLVVRSEIRASKVMADRVLNHPKIQVTKGAVPLMLHGEDSLQGMMIDVGHGFGRNLPVTGLFVAIGQDPRTDLVKGQLELTDEGTIDVEPGTTRTSIPGVFAAGDVADSSYRQAITAAASGCKAAVDVERYLGALADQPAQQAA